MTELFPERPHDEADADDVPEIDSELLRDFELLEDKNRKLEVMNLSLIRSLSSRSEAQSELGQRFEDAAKAWAAEKGRLTRRNSELFSDVLRLENSNRSLKFQVREMEVTKLEHAQVSVSETFKGSSGWLSQLMTEEG